MAGSISAGVLSGKSIQYRINKGDLHIRPLLSQDQITETGVDFRLGYDFLVSIQGRGAYINTQLNLNDENTNISQFFQASRRQLGETFILHPHQTVLAVTLEYVKIPQDTLLMLYLRSSYVRLGLTVSTVVQPGYCGCISLELTNPNHTPVNLTVGARILQGILIKVSDNVNYFSKSRKYLCHVRPEPSAVSNDPDLDTLSKIVGQ